MSNSMPEGFKEWQRLWYGLLVLSVLLLLFWEPSSSPGYDWLQKIVGPVFVCGLAIVASLPLSLNGPQGTPTPKYVFISIGFLIGELIILL